MRKGWKQNEDVSKFQRLNYFTQIFTRWRKLILLVHQAKFQFSNMRHTNESLLKRRKGHLLMSKVRITDVQGKEILIARHLLLALKSTKLIKSWIHTI